MLAIDSGQLYNDNQYYFKHVSKFVDFGEKDTEAIQQVAQQLRSRIPFIVETVYKKLLEYDDTLRLRFLGIVRSKSANDKGKVTVLIGNKESLKRYLARIMHGPYDERFADYLQWVAADTQNTTDIIHIHAFLGFLENALISEIMSLKLADRAMEETVLRAFNKLLWIQGNYFAKHHDNGHRSSRWPTLASWGLFPFLPASLRECPMLPVVAGALAGGLIIWFHTKRTSS